MSETEISEWLKLLQGGGNAAIIVLAILAIRVATYFLKALKDIVDTMQRNHAELIAGQEDIKRAMVARDPATAPMFDRQRRGGA